MTDQYIPEPGHLIRTNISEEAPIMSDRYVPEPGHLIALTGYVVPRTNAVEVRHVDDDIVAGVWTSASRASFVVRRDAELVRVAPTSDGMYDLYRPHSIDDRLPDWLTWAAIDAFVAIRPGMWLNVYPYWFPTHHASQSAADLCAQGDRVACIHPDGNTINVCDGKTILDTHH